MKYIAHFQRIQWMLAGVVMACLTVSCTEEIDTSARFTQTEHTILSYLEEGEVASEFTEYVELLKHVSVSTQSSSTVAQFLSARGKYTCFAPDNKAIYDYLDSLKVKGIITEASWDGFQSQETLDSIRKVIVLNSILDGSSSNLILEMGEIESKNDKDEFPLPNLYNRKLYKTSIDQTDSIFINGTSLIDLKNRDVLTINGRVHRVHGVIAPSNDTMTDLFRQMIAENKKGFIVMAKLILACGLEDTLSKTQDDVWETLYLRGEIQDLKNHPTEPDQPGTMPEHRKYGFTIFAEPDELWETELASIGINKTYDQINVKDIQQYLTTKGLYPNAQNDADYKNEDNIINQFVTYHILPEKLSPDKLVIHYNENGYYFATNKKNYTVPVYEYFTTMGKRRLLKIFQSAESVKEDTEREDGNAGIFLNRFPILRNGRGDYSDEKVSKNNDYHESGQFKAIGSAHHLYEDENVGNKIMFETPGGAYHQNLINSCIYPIQRVLAYTENTQNRLAGERIRIDMAAMFPEFINNDIRRPMSYYSYGATFTRAVPITDKYRYVDNLVEIRDGTEFYYFGAYGRGWSNYQMDEFNIIGKYEFTMKLPPVPKKGHYEIRFGVSSGSSVRSMCQVYFGDNINYLPAIGIPMDLRIGFVNHRFRGGTNINSNFGYASNDEYKKEATLSMEDQDKISKNLRARGFMKGPKYFHCGASNTADLGIQCEHVTRRIMVSKDLDPDKTYYIRFKNVLDDIESQFFMDYFEFVSKDVYDNPVEPEDIW